MNKGLVAALAAALVATACSGGGDEDSSSEGATKQPGQEIQLTFWSWVPGIDDAVELWNSENPEVQVKVEEISGDTYAKMQAALQAGNAPDLAQIEYEMLPTFRLNDGLEELTQHGAASHQEKFVPWQWEQGVFGDGVYAIPQASGPMAMYYRADLFDKWGIEVPATWTEYEQAAARIREQDAYINTFSPASTGWFTGLAWQSGANWFGTEGDTWTVDMSNEETTRVTDYWDGLIEKDLVATKPDFSTEWYRDLQDGKIVTYVGASWADAILKENAPKTAGKWRVAPMPQWDGSDPAAGNFGGSSTALLKGADYPAEALEFAVWLNTDPDSIAVLSEGGYGWPAAALDFAGSPLDKEDPFFGGQNYNKVFAEADSQVDKEWTWIPTFGETAASMADGFKAATESGSSLTDVVTGLETETVEDLENKGLTVASP